MLYQTLSQPYVFLSLFAVGILCGFLFDFSRVFSKLCNKNIFLTHFFNFFAVIISAAVFFVTNLFVNFGQFRAFSIAAFLAGLLLQQLLSTKIFAKFAKRCYNKLHGKRKKKQDS